MNDVDLTNLLVTLAFLAGPAGVIAWMVYWSNLLRNLRVNPIEELSPIGQHVARWLQQRSPEVLQLIHAVGAMLLPIIAKIILELVPPDMLAVAQPYYAFAAFLLFSYLGSQIWHQFTKAVPQPSASVTTSVTAAGGMTATAQVSASAPPELDTAPK